MSERERVEREQRLAEIRQAFEATKYLADLGYEGRKLRGPTWADRYALPAGELCFTAVPYLLAEVERLTAERHGERAPLEYDVVQAAMAWQVQRLAMARMRRPPAKDYEAYDRCFAALIVALDALLKYTAEHVEPLPFDEEPEEEGSDG